MVESHKSSKSDDAIKALLDDPLELPEGSSFQAVPAKLDVAVMIAISELYLPIINARPDFIEVRRKHAFDVQFVL